MSQRVVLYTDGASRGNPGEAAIGAVLYDERGELLGEVSEAIGVATNNVAEYQAVLAGLDLAAGYEPSHLVLRADSQLLVRQINGEYRVKAANLKPLFAEVRQKLAGFPKVTVEHVRREKNVEADALANAALDA